MLRKLTLALFLATLAAGACGRQVTGLDGGGGGGNRGLLPGKMSVKYRTAAPMDFTRVRYWIVFNTSGNGLQPYAWGVQTGCSQAGYANYSFAWMIGGGPFGTVPTAQLFQYIVQPGPGGQATVVPLPVPPQLAQLALNSDGRQTEFTLIFDRTLLFGVAGPTATPGASPAPTSPTQNIWNINLFTSDLNNVPLNALGAGGVCDRSFVQRVDVNQVQDITAVVPGGAVQAPFAAAQLAGDEVQNNP